MIAFNDGSKEAANCAPPPPIDHPETAKLFTSTFPFNGDASRVFSDFTVSMASNRANDLDAGQSAQGSFVPKVMAIIP